jgi:hypothetical protein
MTQVMAASAAIINVRRIRQFEETRRKELEAKRRNEEKAEGQRKTRALCRADRVQDLFSFWFSMSLSPLLPFRLHMAI